MSKKKKKIPLWKQFIDETIDVKPARKRKVGNEVLGLKTGLSISRWLELIFHWNELRAMERFANRDLKPLNDMQILNNFVLEFAPDGKCTRKKGSSPNAPPGNTILSGKKPIAYQRLLYNRGHLYSAQEKPILLANKYWTDGNLVTSRSRFRPTYMSFKEVQLKCIEFKIADPRFFTMEEIEQMHQSLIKRREDREWAIPSIEDLDELFKSIPYDPYRTVITYDLHKNPTKKNKPTKQKSETIPNSEEAETKKQEKLEQKRQETKRLLESIEFEAD
jgi:hypothetical protein